ncbi:hypothetical protein C8R46DRAFT_81804 [Mycena filopes]|nr:hypothetical protein C8R46DRAFT_81804 [Mycena filopes]
MPKSPLLGSFIHALCQVATELDKDLAAQLHKLLAPQSFPTVSPLPANFDLEGISCLRSTVPGAIIWETYPYTPEERVAIAPFCTRPFVLIFPLLRDPSRIKRDNAKYLLPPFEDAMAFLRSWLHQRPAFTPLEVIQQRLVVSMHQCIDAFSVVYNTTSWKRGLPNFDVEMFPRCAYSLVRTVYPPWPYGRFDFSNVRPMFRGEPRERDPTYDELLDACSILYADQSHIKSPAVDRQFRTLEVLVPRRAEVYKKRTPAAPAHGTVADIPASCSPHPTPEQSPSPSRIIRVRRVAPPEATKRKTPSSRARRK